MSEHTPPYLSDAMARFRAAADSATAGSRRVVADAAASGAAFERDSEAAVRALRDHEPVTHDVEPTAEEHRRAAAEYREAQGLPVPSFPEPELVDDDDWEPAEPPVFRQIPDEDDFGQIRIMRPL